MHQSKQTDPLHGITLQGILEFLESRLGWQEMGERVSIKCFTQDPSIKSSLKFLRKTPWARTKVEQMYISIVTHSANKKTVAPKPTEDFVWPELPKK